MLTANLLDFRTREIREMAIETLIAMKGSISKTGLMPALLEDIKRYGITCSVTSFLTFFQAKQVPLLQVSHVISTSVTKPAGGSYQYQKRSELRVKNSVYGVAAIAQPLSIVWCTITKLTITAE